ncbi:hypothetical protein K0U83_02685 [bacterium]|nr:hypothetical protein [bacterium]
MTEPLRTTEDLWAVSTAASPTAKLDIRADKLIKRGTEVVSCDKLADRWVITVLLDGKGWAGVTFRNPFGVTRGELLGPRFALAGKVKLKVARGKVPKGAKGAIVGYWGLDRYQVRFGAETMTIDGKHLTPCSVERAARQKEE